MNIKRKALSLINRQISRGQWFNEMKFVDCQKFWSFNQFDTVVVNLGSSSSVYAFDYSDIPMKCANWAMRSNPLSGDYAVLKNYFSYLREKGATVIISLCPFSSLAGRYTITEDRYYSILYPSSIPGYSIRRHHQINSEVQCPLSTYPLVALCSDVKNVFLKSRHIIMSEEQMAEDADEWMKNWMREFSIEDFSYPLSLINMDAIDEAAYILNEMVTFCKDRDLRPVILIPPVYHTLGDRFTPDIREKVILSLIRKIDDKSVWFHDFMDDEDFSNDITLFSNSFLLNEKGAKKFTKKVLDSLYVSKGE